MSDEMRPPPLPRSSEATEPGLGLLALKNENARLRRERNEARDALLTGSAPGSSPPPTRRQRNVGHVISLGKYAALLTILPALGAVVAKHWPEYADVVQAIISVLGN